MEQTDRSNVKPTRIIGYKADRGVRIVEAGVEGVASNRILEVVLVCVGWLDDVEVVLW